LEPRRYKVIFKKHMVLPVSQFSHGAVGGWHITTQRLGAAAASTTFHAGDKRSIPHKTFRGATAAVAPNRKLYAAHLPIIV
jgi:hypothetical protein